MFALGAARGRGAGRGKGSKSRASRGKRGSSRGKGAYTARAMGQGAAELGPKGKGQLAIPKGKQRHNGKRVAKRVGVGLLNAVYGLTMAKRTHRR